MADAPNPLYGMMRRTRVQMVINMNLPNKITVFRFIMIPVFATVLLVDFPFHELTALIVFLIASVSDFLDGYLARKMNLVTDFGKLMDPLADKMLVSVALVCFVALKPEFPCWCAIIILAREFIITGIRQLAAEKHVIIQASWWGKSKTVVQLIMCIMYLLESEDIAFTQQQWYITGETIAMIAATVLTVISLVDYIIKNIDIMKNASK